MNSDLNSEDDNPVNFCKSLAHIFPELSKVAIEHINTPVSSVDVERSFSLYRDILSHKRTQLKNSSLNTLCMINYNHNFNDDMDE